MGEKNFIDGGKKKRTPSARSRKKIIVRNCKKKILAEVRFHPLINFFSPNVPTGDPHKLTYFITKVNKE